MGRRRRQRLTAKTMVFLVYPTKGRAGSMLLLYRFLAAYAPSLLKSGFSDPFTLEHTDTPYSYPHTVEARLVSSQLSTGGDQEPRHPIMS